MSFWKRLFLGRDGRPRAGWRIFCFLVALSAVSAGVTLFLRAVIGPTPGDPATAAALRGLLAASVASLVVFGTRRWIDRKPVRGLGLEGRSAVPDLLAGFLLSAGFVGAAVAALNAAGWADVRVSGIPGARLFFLFLGAAATVAWWEELVFRGYILQNLQEGLGTNGAVVLSCLLYGLVHAANPGANVVSALVVSAIGFLRIFAYIESGQLWLSMGMHAGWNFFQGPVFGLPVSGRGSESLLSTKLDGPLWATGGAFGLEASGFGLIYAILGAVAVLLWVKRKRTAVAVT